MSEKLLIETSPIETRVARLSGSRLEAFHIVPAGSSLLSATPVHGRIRSVVPALEAAFVDIGLTQDAFLPLSKAMLGSSVEGDLVLAGLSHLGAGDKGARLSREISLPGRGLVLLMAGNGIHYSRQLDAEPRSRLVALASRLGLDQGRFGLIVRTEAACLGDEVLRNEFEALILEAEVLLATGKAATSPGAILPEDASLALFLRGMNLADTSIHVDNRALAVRLEECWRPVRPDLAGAIHVEVTRKLMESAGVDETIENLLSGRMKLPSGGEIVIQPTEALTAIDVNTGETTRVKGEAGNKASRALQTNIEAVDKIARALRVANIGGLVAIDFLKMSGRGDETRIYSLLQEAFAGDPAAVRIGGFSKLGLVDLSRARRGPSLHDLLADKGRHVSLNDDALAARAVRLALREAEASPGCRVVCQTSSQVGARITALQGAAKGDMMGALEARTSYESRQDFARDQIEVKAEG